MKISNYLGAMLIAASFVMGACSSDDEATNNPEGGNLVATITPTSTFSEAIAYGTPLTIEANIAVSEGTLSKIVLTGVKNEGGTYTAVGEAQSATAKTGNVSLTFYPDSKEMNAIEIKAMGRSGSESAYIEVSEGVSGTEFSAYANKSVLLYANDMVKNHENSSEDYPTEYTSAEAPLKAFFSIHGVEIDGVKSHVLSLDELRSVNGTDGSFTFVNVLKNTSSGVTLGSQRGYALMTFWGTTLLSSGTIGRQCDLYKVGENQINKDNADQVTMNLVRGQWYSEREQTEIDAFNYIDALYVQLGDPATSNLDKLKLHNLLEGIQSTFDNSTLGVIESPTSLSDNQLLRLRVDAGSSSEGTADKMTDVKYKAGDYIILKSVRGSIEYPEYYYGIAYIKSVPDDTIALSDSGQSLDADKTQANLFGKPIELDIRTQIEL